MVLVGVDGGFCLAPFVAVAPVGDPAHGDSGPGRRKTSPHSPRPAAAVLDRLRHGDLINTVQPDTAVTVTAHVQP